MSHTAKNTRHTVFDSAAGGITRVEPRMLCSITVNDDSSSIVISIVIAILVDDNCFVSISVVITILVDNHGLRSVAIPVTVDRPDCYAVWTNTNSYLFCSGRYCAANTCRGRNYNRYTSDH
jgi:hypothetical protein